MNNRVRSLSFMILSVGLAASAFGVIGFLNPAYAANSNMSDNMNTNATVTANMTGHSSGNMTGTSGNMTGNTTSAPPPVQKMMAPLEQFKSGTPAKTIQCGQGLSLVIKIEDGSPACVSPTVAQILVARAWGTMP